jgi:arginase
MTKMLKILKRLTGFLDKLLPHSLPSNSSMLKVLGIPTNLGCNTEGCHLAPAILRDKNIIQALETTSFPIQDLGDVVVPFLMPEKNRGDSKAKNLEQIVEVAKSTLRMLADNLKSSDKLLTIGGDHSIGMSTVFSSTARSEDLCVLWIDAHADCNAPETTLTGNIHGMPLSTVLGGSLFQYFDQVAVKKENAILFGIKDVDEAEWDFIRANNITAYTIDDIVGRGIGPIWQEIQAKINGRPLHVSLDIDSLDNEIAPGTGIVNQGGVNYREIKYLARQIAGQNLIALDVAEINPLRDIEDQTVDLAIELIADFFGGQWSEYERYLAGQQMGVSALSMA